MDGRDQLSSVPTAVVVGGAARTPSFKFYGMKNPRAAAENQEDPKSRTEGINNLVAPLVACSTLGCGDIQLASGTHCLQEGQQREKKEKENHSIQIYISQVRQGVLWIN